MLWILASFNYTIISVSLKPFHHLEILFTETTMSLKILSVYLGFRLGITFRHHFWSTTAAAVNFLLWIILRRSLVISISELWYNFMGEILTPNSLWNYEAMSNFLWMFNFTFCWISNFSFCASTCMLNLPIFSNFLLSSFFLFSIIFKNRFFGLPSILADIAVSRALPSYVYTLLLLAKSIDFRNICFPWVVAGVCLEFSLDLSKVVSILWGRL